MGILSTIKNFFIRAQSSIVLDPFSNFKFWNTNIANNETIFAVVTRLSNSMASLPLKLYQNYNVVNAYENDIAELIESPNSFMTQFKFIRKMETLKNMTGNAYALIEYDMFMTPIALHILNPDLVEPVIEKDTNELWYRVIDSDGSIYIHNSNIIHIHHITGVVGEKGINPLDILKNTVDYDREIKEFSLNQLQNGLKANVVIKLASKLNKDAMDDYTEMLKRFQKNGILFLDNGKDFKELSGFNFIDPKVFDVEKITVERVARVYNMPLSKLNSEKSSYNSSEQADLEYIKDTMLPNTRMWEQETNRKLLTHQQRKNGFSLKFNLNGLARADMNTRGNFYFKGIRSAWFTPNEVRSLEDMPPKPGGDKLYVSKDLISLDLLNAPQVDVDGGENNVQNTGV
ncbi:phage portal protein [Clostridium sp. AWRP]|uniref:phage portal protein n=1 Tax=Clostridium sp. AWRP TaxID=2212991 RepID=UPI000FDC2480|nr:phage portal protein [Clostridium sp. AWRP]AZV56793.1 phage portal protein [Clostridium sp. AWRP]